VLAQFKQELGSEVVPIVMCEAGTPSQAYTDVYTAFTIGTTSLLSGQV